MAAYEERFIHIPYQRFPSHSPPTKLLRSSHICLIDYFSHNPAIHYLSPLVPLPTLAEMKYYCSHLRSLSPCALYDSSRVIDEEDVSVEEGVGE